MERARLIDAVKKGEVKVVSREKKVSKNDLNMKFSRRTYPILDLIERKQLHKLDFRKCLSDDILENTDSATLNKHVTLGSAFLKTFNTHSYKISYFAPTIFDKVEAVFKKTEELQKELAECRGLFLLPDETSIFYEYKSDMLTILHSCQNQFTGYGTMSFNIEPLETGENLSIEMIPVPKIQNGEVYFGDDYGDRLIFSTALGYILFYHFVELEIVVLSESKSYKRKATVDNTLYSTQSKLKIEIVDSTWFKTFIRTEGFDVRGHFRLQPFGEGGVKRKLIWIDEYEKQGYNLKAKMQQLDNE